MIIATAGLLVTMTAAVAAQDEGQTPAERIQTSSASVNQITATIASIVASEEPCGLSYDRDEIAAYVEREVPPGSVDFTAGFNREVGYAEYALRDMTTSQKTAHCTNIQRVARFVGFIE